MDEKRSRNWRLECLRRNGESIFLMNVFSKFSFPNNPLQQRLPFSHVNILVVIMVLVSRIPSTGIRMSVSSSFPLKCISRRTAM
jgi:hypothetical protein